MFFSFIRRRRVLLASWPQHVGHGTLRRVQEGIEACDFSGLAPLRTVVGMFLVSPPSLGFEVSFYLWAKALMLLPDSQRCFRSGALPDTRMIQLLVMAQIEMDAHTCGKFPLPFAVEAMQIDPWQSNVHLVARNVRSVRWLTLTRQFGRTQCTSSAILPRHPSPRHMSCCPG